MAYTFHIDDTSNPKVKAFLAYIKSLDFVRTTEDKEFTLSEKQLRILDERRNDRIKGNSKSHTWEEVKKSARTKMRNASSKK